MRFGFSLIEVVVALVVLQIGIVGMAGVLQLASSTLARAEAQEAMTADVEGVVDSLFGAASVTTGSRAVPGGNVTWVVAPDGSATVRGVSAIGVELLVVETVVPFR